MCENPEEPTPTGDRPWTGISGWMPRRLRLAKAAVHAAMETPLSAGLALERELFITAFASEDRKEGVAAFLEKREAKFTGT